MTLKLGIPQGLFYYRYHPFWNEFFSSINVETIVSGPTNKAILELGASVCVDEACLPVKIFHGHVAGLRGKADCIFVPRYTSISRNEYICPKFGGLPDMIKCSIENLPPLIDPEFNLHNNGTGALKSLIELGKRFGKGTPETMKAVRTAGKALGEYRAKIMSGAFPGDILNRKRTLRSLRPDTLNILLIGHPYNIYDSFVNLDLAAKLRKRGAEVITPDMYDEKMLKKNTGQLKKKMFWHFGSQALGCVYYAMKAEKLDGVIYVMSFGCGIDSFICSMAERRIRQSSEIPFILLTLDEHTGEAGLDTRVEAFIDLIRWRKKGIGNISALG